MNPMSHSLFRRHHIPVLLVIVAFAAVVSQCPMAAATLTDFAPLASPVFAPAPILKSPMAFGRPFNQVTAPNLKNAAQSASGVPFGHQPERHFASDAFLSSKGLIAAEMPWATTMPDIFFELLFGGSKAQVAAGLHAQKARARKIQRIHDMIDMVALTDPGRAQSYRTLWHRGLPAAR